MTYLYLQLFGGLIYLFIGGDLLVRGAAALSKRARVPPMVVGLTVVALGTSAPELVVSVRSALSGHPGLALGNVVGSNIANVLLVIGIPAIIAPLACDQPTIRVDTAITLLASILFVGLSVTGELGLLAGLVLLCGLVLFVLYNVRAARVGQRRPPDPGELERALGLPAQRRMIVLFIVLGVIALPLGADLLVEGAVELAAQLGVAEAVVGLTIVAIGTSLPELATTLVAAFQRRADVAIGNVLGSNVFNLLGIMGVTTVVSPAPIPVPGSFLWLDYPVMLGSAFLLAWYTMRKATVRRSGGVLLTVAYGLYVLALFGRR